MHEITRVTLENEMDLILAHKRSMKLAELAGLALSSQTSFATAVSEVGRSTIERNKKGCLILLLDIDSRENHIIARINDEEVYDTPATGWKYAKRLVKKMDVSAKGSETTVDLFCRIAPSFRIDTQKIDEWRRMFRNEPAVSPYEELKQKNEQLLELSERVQKSEAQYKTLTNALPLAIFSLDKEGRLRYANEWLTAYTGETIESLNAGAWNEVLNSEDLQRFLTLLPNNSLGGSATISAQFRIREKSSGNYFWHQLSLTPFKNEKEELLYWIGAVVDIHAQKVVEETLQDNVELKDAQNKLEEFNRELERSNRELEQFAYIASHDLQEPVRKILFYTDYLLRQHSTSFDEKAVGYLQTVKKASGRMRSLIQDILTFSLVNKDKLQFHPIDLSKVLKDVIADFEVIIEEKKARIEAGKLPIVNGDEGMMRQLMSNIIGNSLKYSRPAVAPVIEVSALLTDNFHEIIFRDNGIGFDSQYVPQMFTLFQRLHSKDTYEGTGLGLAICRKIVELHGGKIDAEGVEGEGAKFVVTLPE